ncbi:MAG: GatB/YqeY domain-containing protein [Clostridia bacterium]|jgi:uncharacterized protein YqeY|nr:GatB/YqeY domain-containing protein [Clostridia bacterium]
MLKDLLMDDLKLAMKEKDIAKKNTIQLVRSAIQSFEKDNKTDADEAKVIEIVSKELKKRKDSLPEFEKSGRDDLIEGLKVEIAILEKYLPEQMSDDDLLLAVKAIIDESGATSMKEMGKVMGMASAKLKGKADNGRISKIVKEALS